MLTGMKVVASLLGAAACLIAFLALTEEYERDIVSEPTAGRVLEVTDDRVRYEKHSPGSPWDEDGDGWIGPYSDDEVPDDVRGSLSPGDPITLRAGKLEQSLAPPSPLLLVGLVLCLLFGVWSIVGPILERRAIQRARHEPMRFIELMIRKTRTTKIVSGSLTVLMSAPIMAAGIFLGEKLWEQIFLGALGGLGVVLGFVFLAGAWQLRDPKNAPILQVIRHHPERIVWMYVYELEVNNVPVYTLYLCGDDGSRYDFNLAQLEPQLLLDTLAGQLPQAVIGYSKEREKAWSASPATFRASLA